MPLGIPAFPRFIVFARLLFALLAARTPSLSCSVKARLSTLSNCDAIGPLYQTALWTFLLADIFLVAKMLLSAIPPKPPIPTP